MTIVIKCIISPERHFVEVIELPLERRKPSCFIVSYLCAPSLYNFTSLVLEYEQVIKAATDGWGTDEDALTRVIISRAEIDLIKVKKAYFDIHKTSLDKLVKDETSGDYGAFLIALLGQ